MHLDAQSLVGPALGALYLKDCFLLLARDEAVLVRGWRGRWRAGFGLLDWRLRGRETYLCHPFKPWQPVLRLRWDAAAAGPAAPAVPAYFPRRPALGQWVGAIWLLLFVALPLAFYGHLGTRVMLTLLGELYALIAISLALVWRRRAALGLSNAAFALLAFEVLACAPYAANLVRRLSLQRAVDEDLVSAGTRLLDAQALAALNIPCRARILDELDWAAEDSPRALALREALPRFEAAVPAEGEHERF